ncbi:hypothetical protein BAUCODRAFT_26551 [Baudoinia panamericana UAMH 10762]|uniref:Transcriptional regulatory protein DEP1 n=1 Tax=Baudoinia panamericana (strain UAMH 10762) TaxID=717646 RepID=M2LGL3_BAUPA|nr:uncharacterized protein BAUCODRAFT_26551 [Baudoinia panamericana UAMH 10762]EMC93227.1 hypothetical protein BAUCODRAFT_26551 [Baudoinia panamericana UAMH 10762]
MAQSATARRSEPHSSKFTTDLDAHHHAPLRSSQQPASRASTPRPSVSPLSTASRANKSPITPRKMAVVEDAVEEGADADNAVLADPTEIGEQHDDRSSSLSEPDDEQDLTAHELEAIDGTDVAQRPARGVALDVDSEAETERLENTPQKPRRLSDAIGKTPSKLSQAATAEEELSDPPSPLPVGAGAASSTSTVMTGIKRKRSDTAESPLTSAESDLEESPRKRSSEEPIEGAVEELADVDGAVDGLGEDIAEESVAIDGGEVTPLPSALLKATKGRKGKLKGKPGKERTAESRTEQTLDDTTPLEPLPSGESAVKTEDEAPQKAAATNVYEEVAKQFASFRDKLYTERLASLTVELDLLTDPNSTHPEYLRLTACLNTRRDKQIREAESYYRYRLRSTRDRTIAERTQLHSQYFQRVREARERVLYGLGEEWYGIQRERRQQHQEGDEAFVFKFDGGRRGELLRQQARWNKEVSVLSGVARWVGWPAAPEVVGVDGEEAGGDLKAMKVSLSVFRTGSSPAALANPLPPPPAPPPKPHKPNPNTSSTPASHPRTPPTNA